MQHCFLQRKGTPTLLLFFTGWGMDEQPFLSEDPFPSDCLLCYNYNTPDFDYSLLNSYTSIRLLAWSMGIWQASMTLADYTDVPIVDSLALNGTVFPIDEQCGITPDIAYGTYKGLTETSLNKFRRRMCGTSTAYSTFMTHVPKRNVSDLQAELYAIITRSTEYPAPHFQWRKAYIGTNDRIFLPNNQQTAWDKSGISPQMHPIAHYDYDFLHLLLHTHSWINS